MPLAHAQPIVPISPDPRPPALDQPATTWAHLWPIDITLAVECTPGPPPSSNPRPHAAHHLNWSSLLASSLLKIRALRLTGFGRVVRFFHAPYPKTLVFIYRKHIHATRASNCE